MREMSEPFTRQRVRLARTIAVAADLLQIALLPALVAPPVGEGLNIAIDVAAGAALCMILRPHWAFAPTFIAEAIPVVQGVPIWTAAVLFVTRGPVAPDSAEPLPPG